MEGFYDEEMDLIFSPHTLLVPKYHDVLFQEYHNSVEFFCIVFFTLVSVTPTIVNPPCVFAPSGTKEHLLNL